MKNLTGSKFLHPRFWTQSEEAIVTLIVNNRKKNKTLHHAFTKAARVTNRSVSAVAVRYYTNLKPTSVIAGNVHKKITVGNVSKRQTLSVEMNTQLVCFVKTLFTRLTPAEKAEVLKNLD